MLVLPRSPRLRDALWQAEEVQRRRVSARGEKQSARPHIARELGRKGESRDVSVQLSSLRFQPSSSRADGDFVWEQDEAEGLG